VREGGKGELSLSVIVANAGKKKKEGCLRGGEGGEKGLFILSPPAWGRREREGDHDLQSEKEGPKEGKREKIFI